MSIILEPIARGLNHCVRLVSCLHLCLALGTITVYLPFAFALTFDNTLRLFTSAFITAIATAATVLALQCSTSMHSFPRFTFTLRLVRTAAAATRDARS
jgi:hypothetical protein